MRSCLTLWCAWNQPTIPTNQPSRPTRPTVSNWLTNQSPDSSTNQSTYQSTNQITNQSTNQKQSMKQWINKIKRTVYRTFCAWWNAESNGVPLRAMFSLAALCTTDIDTASVVLWFTFDSCNCFFFIRVWFTNTAVVFPLVLFCLFCFVIVSQTSTTPPLLADIFRHVYLRSKYIFELSYGFSSYTLALSYLGDLRPL